LTRVAPALFVRTRFVANTGVVFSEDMKDVQNYEGVLIQNPFSR
jgi:predicted nucleic acid-binding protein